MSGQARNRLPTFPTANAILRMARFSDVRWARPDLNRRPPGYQPGAPAKLSYGPSGGGRLKRLYLFRDPEAGQATATRRSVLGSHSYPLQGAGIFHA